MPAQQDPNYTREAFLHPWNLTFLIAALAITFGAGLLGAGEVVTNLLLLFTAAAELLFLGTVPRDARFQKAVRSLKAAERKKQPSQKEVFATLSRTDQRRYGRLRRLESDIKTNYEKLSYASQGLLDSHRKKIGGLLDSYLNLLHQRERYAYAMQQTTQSELAAAISALQQDMSDDPPRVRAVKERRLKILQSRLDRSKKGRENLEILDAQLATIEDVVQYIHEQSLTLRNPEEITFQLDTLLEEVEETERSVLEVEDVFSSAIPGEGAMLDEPEKPLLDQIDDDLNALDRDLDGLTRTPNRER
jgi:hypothetical protein